MPTTKSRVPRVPRVASGSDSHSSVEGHHVETAAELAGALHASEAFLQMPAQVKADDESYEESGASPVNLKVDSQDVKSLTTTAGVNLGYAFRVQSGRGDG